MTETPSNKARIFSVSTRFQQMARRPGGPPRDVAIQQAQSQIEGFRTEFVDWVDRELEDLFAAFRKIRQTGSAASQVDDIYGRCSQLRDTGTTMGLELVTFIAGNLCKVLDTIKAGAPYDSDVIDCHIDALLLAKQEPYRTIRPDQVPEMTDGLHRMLERARRSLAAAGGEPNPAPLAPPKASGQG